VTGRTGFFVASGIAAAALTGLLFIAITLRPREMADAPDLLRARAAFIAVAVVTFVSLLELIPGNRLAVGAGLILFGPAAPALTVRFAVGESVSRWQMSALFLGGGWIFFDGVLPAVRPLCERGPPSGEPSAALGSSGGTDQPER
jgi:hypothetical protein